MYLNDRNIATTCCSVPFDAQDMPCGTRSASAGCVESLSNDAEPHVQFGGYPTLHDGGKPVLAVVQDAFTRDNHGLSGIQPGAFSQDFAEPLNSPLLHRSVAGVQLQQLLGSKLKPRRGFV
jgi:hypothetical protein